MLVEVESKHDLDGGLAPLDVRFGSWRIASVVRTSADDSSGDQTRSVCECRVDERGGDDRREGDRVRENEREDAKRGTR